MRVLVRIILHAVVIVLLAAAAALGWFYLYPFDLPQVKHIAAYAPETAGMATDECLDTQIPVDTYEQLGHNLRISIRAAEVKNPAQASRYFALQIARHSFCNPGKQLAFQFKALRLASQLRIKYSEEELLTIYANRAYYGDDQVGAEAASRHYYGKHAWELDLAEATMIAGMLRAPLHYSPMRNPENAAERRNQVLDSLLAHGQITSAQAKSAKVKPVMPVSR